MSKEISDNDRRYLRQRFPKKPDTSSIWDDCLVTPEEEEQGEKDDKKEE